jgi:hypothetical protein
MSTTKKNQPAKPGATSAKSTVKKLSEKMTSEAAIKFLNAEKIKKEKIALTLYNETADKIKKMGCNIGVKLSLDGENKIIPQIVILSK